MSERRKLTITYKLNQVSKKQTRVAVFANFMIVLLTVIWLVGVFYPDYYKAHAVDTGLPPLVLIFLVYAVKVLVVEYLNARVDAFEKELDDWFYREKK